MNTENQDSEHPLEALEAFQTCRVIQQLPSLLAVHKMLQRNVVLLVLKVQGSLLNLKASRHREASQV